METRRSYGQACSFCSKRKIKCSGVYPCNNCAKRGRGGDCRAQPHRPPRKALPSAVAPKVHTTDLGAGASRQSRDEQPYEDPRPRASDTVADCSDLDVQQSDTVEGPGRIPLQQPALQLGTNSMPSFVDHAVSPSYLNDLQDIRPALGLQNASSRYPFMVAGGETEKQSPRLPFSHAQVLKYAQVYESVVSPLYPFVPSYDDLDALILAVLERTADVGAGGIDDGGTCKQPIDHGSKSLVCAVLACGAQMSDDKPAQRLQQSRQFAQHAFNFARFANFLLRPNEVTVRTMLLLSFFLQNDGQADAAWSLLGTVSRLAMAIGLCKPRSTAAPGATGEDNIWLIIEWQDCLLSLCFDRVALAPPVAGKDWMRDTVATPEKYLDLMKRLISMSHQWLAEPEASRSSTSVICGYIDRLDAIDLGNDDSSQVQSLSETRRTRIKRYLLELYGGYIRSVICRPALRAMDRCNDASYTSKILRSAVAGTHQTLCAYVALSKLTKLPSHTWSMIHAGLSSAIMVEFLEFAGGSSALRQAQATFLNLLAREDEDTVLHDREGGPALLTSPHSSYLRALRELLRQREQRRINPAAGGEATNLTWPSAIDAHEVGGDRTYENAKKHIASINNARESSLNLAEFDWSLISWDVDAGSNWDPTFSSMCF